METIAKIRRYYFRDKRKIKEISRLLGISKNTVRKVVRSGQTEHKYARENQPQPQIGPFVERLKGLLEEDLNRPKKRRLTAMRLLELIEAEGYSGSYDSIQRFVKRWRIKQGEITKSNKCYIPLQFAPGDAYQFDWSHEEVIINGIEQKVKVAHFRLSHSRQFFIVAYFRESSEMVLDAHNQAFSFFGGTCNRGIYDNMTTAVSKVLHGKERIFNRRFSQLCSHYLVEPVACTPGAGWEKGQVEKQVKNIREWLFTPRPKFKTLEKLNSWLIEQSVSICKTRKHPEDKRRSIWEVFQDEKPFLAPTPQPFTGYIEKECRVSSTSLVNYDRNSYSVNSKAVCKNVTIRATATKIQVVKNGEIIANHLREFGSDKTIYDPWHYLGTLEKKPGAIRNGAPFLNWDLPRSFKQIQKKLLAKPKGDKEFVKILVAAKTHGVDITQRACHQALSDSTCRSEVVLNIIARELDPSPIEPIETPTRLNLKEEPVADCDRYNNLLSEGSNATH